MAKDTKSRIIDAALEMISKNGYAGTNIRELSETLGLSKAAMYRHFESKEDLWNSIYNRMALYYTERFGSVNNLPPVPSSCEELITMTMNMVNFTVHDSKIVQMRKIIMSEQFRDEKIGDMASEYFLYRTERIFAEIFKGMIRNGSMSDTDPAMLAFSFTTPITALVHLCDRDPGKEKEAMEKVRMFAEHFTETYGIKKQ